jgi:hypothetical protein
MIEIKHTFTCDICGEIKELVFCHTEGFDAPTPFIPDGWAKVKGLLVCNKHEIRQITFIDGKEVL